MGYEKLERLVQCWLSIHPEATKIFNSFEKGEEEMLTRLKMNMVGPLLILVTAFLVLSLTGCSRMKNIVSWIPFLDSKEDIAKLDDEELAQFMSTLRPHRGDIASIYGLARYLQEKGKYYLAEAEFRKVIRLDPTHLGAYNGLGMCYDKLGEFPLAEQAYRTALALDPTLDYVHNNLGYSYLLQGDLDMAVEAFEKAVDLNPVNKRYHNNLGMAYVKHGQFDLAFDEFRVAGGEAKAHYNIAHFYYQNGFYEEARIHFTKASTIDPCDADSRKGLAAAESLAKIDRLEGSRISSPSTSLTLEEVDEKHSKKNRATQPSPTLEAFRGRIEAKESQQLGSRIVQPIVGNKSNPSPAVAAWVSENQGLDYNEAHQNKKLATATPHMMRSTEPTGLYHIANKAAFRPVSDFQLDGEKLYALDAIEVEISNGNGIRHMARRIGHFLSERGLREPHLTNARHFDHSETIIYYRFGYLQEAYRVAREIPGYQNMEKAAWFSRPETKVKVLIGKDLIPFDPMFAERSRS
jgi:Flp pilus assembly protein TadD